MSDFFGKLKSGAGKVAFEADKMARVNRVQGELGNIKRQIETLKMKLGEMVYQQYINPAAPTPSVEEACMQIVDLEKQVAAKNEEIQHINAEVYTTAPSAPAPVPAAPAAAPVMEQPAPVEEEIPPVEAAPATRFCTNCGKAVAIGVKFCPDCGNKMI